MKSGSCPICASRQTSPFLNRPQVPVHQNLVVPTADAARSVARGHLSLSVCENCGFVFNRSFDPASLSYSAQYDNTQSCSPYFDAYLDALVADLVEQQGVHNCTVVEVGCGKGHFLEKLVRYPGSGNQGFGFDPSYAGLDTVPDGRLQFRRSYYDQSCTDVKADVVVCRHVIEHVPAPLDLLHTVHMALKNSPNARVFFETPCVEWILHNRVIWDFFYEHCSLFSSSSLPLAFKLTGFAVQAVRHIFGGQYLWLEAVRSSAPIAAGIFHHETARLAQAYAADEHLLCMEWLVRLSDLQQHGKMALWGAGAKGATFANLIDPACRLIDCIVDLNPNKQGGFVPGTGHPIIAPKELVKRNVRCAILMNPNYRSENMQLLAEANIAIDLIDWSA